jgi:hypothetical protein
MNKSDLNSSMLFKMRCGDLCVLLDDMDGGKIFCNYEDIEQGYSSYLISLNDYDEKLSPEGDDYDIIAIKQRNTCVRVVSDVLNDREPENWDWVEEIKDKSEEEANTPIVNNITINITVDPSNNDPEQIIKQINDAIKRNGICYQQ